MHLSGMTDAEFVLEFPKCQICYEKGPNICNTVLSLLTEVITVESSCQAYMLMRKRAAS